MIITGKRRILAIDDAPFNLRLVEAALKQDYDVSVCNSAEDGLKQLETDQFDLILLDVVMPGLDGFSAFHKIRAIPNSEYTPVIFLTGCNDESSEQKGLELGAADFIGKPVNIDLLKLRVRNIINLARLSDAVQAGKERLRNVMDATGDGIWDWDLATNLVSHNLAWCSMLGLEENLLEHPLAFFADLIHPEDFTQVQELLTKSIDENTAYHSEHRLRHANGDYVWVEDRGRVVKRDDRGRAVHMVGCIKNINQRKIDELIIQKLAFYDTLTELPNRRLFLDRTEQAMIRSKRSHQIGALLFIDLDRFKLLNDTHGHAVGDALLIQVGTRLKDIVRQQDTVARIGGDEFVVVIESLSKDKREALAKAEDVGNRILKSLNAPFNLGELNYLSTSSIGLTLFTESNKTIDEVLMYADHAMYEAKKSGRNGLVIAK